jgi:tRNA dimethylallyltransferase
MKKPLIVSVIGPTSSGKSELAVKLAKKIKGEIISADSRQIYRGFDLSSGKVEGTWHGKTFIYKSIPHYLIDEASPRAQYSVAKFQSKAKKIIADIIKRGKVPIICGGTMHWVDSVIYNQSLPEVKPNLVLRQSLQKFSTEQLFTHLQKLDPERAAIIDSKNPRRLIRALEIIESTGSPVPQVTRQSPYDAIWIGINPGTEILHEKILKRINQRLKQGMIQEIAALHSAGLSWKKLEEFGLEFKFVSLHLQGKLTKPEMIEQLFAAHKKYVKRQLTWWKRNKDIHWVTDANDPKLIKLLQNLL